MSALKMGEQVPDFTLPASNGTNVALSDFRGQKVVVYFYPKDNTPGCTTEACDFRDYFSRLTEIHTTVLGISTDSIESHAQFIDKNQLPFLLLSDVDHKVCELYGVWVEKNDGEMGIERSTFLIDEEGKLIQEWRNVKVIGHAAAVYSSILLAERK